MPLIAAGVAFYAFLALVPTLIAAILVYGLVTGPEPGPRSRYTASRRSCPRTRRPCWATRCSTWPPPRTPASASAWSSRCARAVERLGRHRQPHHGRERRPTTRRRPAELRQEARSRPAPDRRRHPRLRVTTSLVAVFPAVANALAHRWVLPGWASRVCGGSSSWSCSWPRSPSSTGWRPTATTRSSSGCPSAPSSPS